ncbi:MAG: Na+/H+ antiporter NhaC family protein [Mogibacterium sp.]|nr:Na+/H+ antiporter NhaC family protein [Mogibacterium sp.]
MEEKKYSVEFHGGKGVAFIPLLVFVVVAILCFTVFHVYDMDALAAGSFAGLILAAFLCKDWGKYWGAASGPTGLGAPVSTMMVLIFFTVSMFSKLMSYSGVAQGFVWLGDKIGISGGGFCVFTFLAACIIATATGTSIGTVFACFPVFYPAGLLLGSNPAFMAGAIISGAVFGDNLAPVSDTTIASSTTQTYTKRAGNADIGGVVASRFKYSIVGAAIASVLFGVFGGGGTVANGAEEILQANMDPKGLVMLIPVVVLVVVAMKTRDVFKSIAIGVVLGSIIALIAGLITPKDIISFQDGAMKGFIYEGVSGIMTTVTFTMSLFAITGVLNESGAMDAIVNFFANSNMAKTPRGAEACIAFFVIVSTIVLGGNAGSSVVMCGPVVDKIGKTQKLHPYRRANLTDGFANSLPINVPVLSAFLFIGAMVIDGLVENYSFIESVSPVSIAVGTVYPFCLFLVLCFSVITGWGRKFEGEDGKPVKEKPED